MADPFQPKFVDLVRNTTTTAGTGNFVLGAAVAGYTGFTAACQVGDSFYYSAIGVDKQAEREIELALLRLRPAVELLARVFQRADAADDIGEHRLFAAAMAEILRQGSAEAFRVVDQHPDRACQPVPADCKRHRKLGIKGGALRLQLGQEVHGDDPS